MSTTLHAAPAAQQLQDRWQERISQARHHRRRFEPIWLSNLAFAAGQHWLVWDPNQKRLRKIEDMDPRYRDRELVAIDRINEQRQAQLGELSSGDDRPQLLLAQDGDEAQELAKTVNAAVAHGWEYEWGADNALAQARAFCLDLGTAAVRCRFDPTKGPALADQVPYHNNVPVLDVDQARDLMANGPRPDVQMRSVHEGRTVWEPLSSFNLLTPPGVTHEDNFPWEIVVRPVPLDAVIEEYPEAEGLTEDSDIASVIGLTTGQVGSQPGQSAALRGHVWLFTCYERPNRRNPNGQVVVLASNQMRFLRQTPQLPYKAPDGTWRSGVHYFHWWRLNDRFWSRAFIEPMKDPQRLISRRETQNAEIIDRGMPKVFTQEGTLVENPQGLPLENVEMKDMALEPHFFAGIGPGQWMYQDIEHHVDNLAHASTLSVLKLGENPQNVNTYAQLALLNENESGKRSIILQQHTRTIADIVEDSVYDIRTYWPPQKMILVDGDEDRISREVFEKSTVPDFYIVKSAKGSAQPRSQGAELTKIDAIWTAAVQCGVVVANAQAWIDWYNRSLDAAQAQELPDVPQDSQERMAAYENFLMLNGQQVQVADYDLPAVHIPEHREAQDEARASGDLIAYELIDQHIRDHVAQQAVNAARVGQAGQLPSPAGPGVPGQQPAAGSGAPMFPVPLLPPAPAHATP